MKKACFALLFVHLAATFPAQADDVIESLLAMPLGELGGITVTTASRTEQSPIEAASVINVITAEDIKYRGYRNIEDVVNDIAGIDAYMDHMGTTRISIRGLSASVSNTRVRMMIDGHDLGIYPHGAPLKYAKHVPIEMVRQIEVIRGPGSALYGANAFAGIINFITKDVDTPSRVSYRSGHYQTHHATGEWTYGKGDISSRIYLDYYKTDGHKSTITSDLATKLFGVSGSAVPGETTSDTEYLSFHGKLNYGNSFLNLFYRKTIDQNFPIGPYVALTDDSDIADESGFIELGHRFELESGDLTLKAYYDRFNSDENYEMFPEETATLFGAIYAAPYPSNEGLHARSKMTNITKGAELLFEATPFESLELVTGLQYENQAVAENITQYNHNPFAVPLTIDGNTYLPYQYLGGYRYFTGDNNPLPESNRELIAVFAHGELDLKNLLDLSALHGLSATLDLRYDEYDDIGSSLTPKTGLVISFDDALYLKVLYGEAFRAPTGTEMFVKLSGALIGNNSLQPETLKTTEIQLGYQSPDDLSGSLTLFHTRVDNQIGTRTRASTSEEVYENFGTLISQGVELEGKYHFGGRDHIYMNTTWQDVQNVTNETITHNIGGSYTQDDFFIGYIPRFMANIGITHRIKPWLVGNLRLNYKGKRERSGEKQFDSSGNLVNVDTRGTLPSSTAVNLTLTAEDIPSADGLTLQLMVGNLFDEKRIEPDPYNRTNSEYEREGRSFFLKAMYEF
ncbi:MAG: TonB-dependent receptor [Sedimenticola sp.]